MGEDLTEIRDVLAAAIPEFEDSQGMDLQRTLADLGLDSLDVCNLILAIEHRLGFCDQEFLSDFPTIVILGDALKYYFQLKNWIADKEAVEKS
jgi:acyl carrier protein